MKFTWKHLTALALTGVLVLLMYLLPLKQKTKDSEIKKPSISGFETSLIRIKALLQGTEKVKLSKLESSEGLKNGDTSALKALGVFWDSIGQPVISAHYYGEIAQKYPGEKSCLDAAYRYFDAFKMTENPNERQEMVQKAMEAYQNVLTYNAQNLDASCDLGVLYAEGTSEPMKGIMMLREVIAKNPKHENAQLNLGLLSLKSNQLPKAIDRFQKVIEINPKNDKAGFLLANTYWQSGEKEKAIKSFQELKRRTNNIELKEEIDKYILQIEIDTNIKK